MAENALPVLSVDIDESRLRRMEEVVNKFNSALAIGPGGFRPPSVPDNKLFPVSPPARQSAGLPGQGKNNGEFDKFLKGLNKQAQGTVRTFGLINKTLGMTSSLLKKLFESTVAWSARIALLGTGGMFGYNVLANHIAAQYRAAQGQNMTTGQMQAAQSVYGSRISGTDNIIQSLAKAQNNPQDPAYAALLAQGINPQDNPGDNLPKVMSSLSGMLNQYKGTGVSQAVLNSMGWGSIVDVATANQIAANDDRIAGFNDDYRNRSTRLDRDLGQSQRSWQDLSGNLQNDGDQIGNSFLKALSRLNGPINNLADQLTADIDKFLNGGNGKAVFDTVADGLEKLGNWLSGPDFQKDLTDFEKEIKNIADSVRDAIHWFNKLTGQPDEPETPVPESAGKESSGHALKSLLSGKYNSPGDLIMAAGHTAGVVFDNAVLNPMQKRAVANARANRASTAGAFRQAWDFLTAPSPMNDPHDRHAQNVLKSHVADANYRAGLPGGMLSAIAGKESSWDSSAISKAGAAGLFQFTTDTAARYGLTAQERFDPMKATGAAAHYLTDNLNRYHGDIAETLAQYNGGNAAITKSGNLSLKMETIQYLKDLLPKIEGGTGQHAGLMARLSSAETQLRQHPEQQRVLVQLEVNQKPGSDIGLSTKSQYTPSFVIPN